MLKQGLVQIYTGNGKGKTTAAIGLAIRAAGQGNKVLIYQFLKPSRLNLGERILIKKKIKQIRIDAPEADWDICRPDRNKKRIAETKLSIKKTLEKIARLTKNKTYDCIILDEIVFCVSNGLAEIEDIKKIIKNRNPSVELVLTGRGATKELIRLADLVTEMKQIKHPFDKGTKARRGIEY